MGWLPILFVVAVAVFSLLQKSLISKQQAQRQQAETVQKPKPEEANPVPRAAATQRVVPKVERSAPSAKEAQLAYEKRRAEAKAVPIDEQKPAQAAQNPLPAWDANAALQGIVYAEILGKPKALRRR